MNLRDLGWAAFLGGDKGGALALTEESLRTLRAIGGWQLAQTLGTLGVMARGKATMVERVRCHGGFGARTGKRELIGRAITLCDLGVLARLEGDAESARALVEESSAEYRQLGLR